MDLRRTPCLSDGLVTTAWSRHFGLRDSGSVVLPGGEPQNKLTGT